MRTILSALGVFVLTLPQAIAVPRYTATDLGTLGGPRSTPTNLNNNGVVVGYSGTDVLNTNAFVYMNGLMQDLGTLGPYGSFAYGINDQGQIVGSSVVGVYNHAFIYENGTMTDLMIPSPKDSRAWGINNAGQITGEMLDALSNAHGFLYNNRTTIDIGNLGGKHTQSFDINELGHVAGAAALPGGGTHAFLYDGIMHDLGALPDGRPFSVAEAMNDLDQVVGYSRGVTGEHAFLYSGGSMLDLGTLGGDDSAAHDINNHGDVVGFSRVLHGTLEHGEHAFLYSGGIMYDLNDLSERNPNLFFLDALGINDRGQIIVEGSFDLDNNEVHAFLLTLKDAVPTPEPTTLSLLCTGLLALGLLRRRLH